MAAMTARNLGVGHRFIVTPFSDCDLSLQCRRPAFARASAKAIGLSDLGLLASYRPEDIGFNGLVFPMFLLNRAAAILMRSRNKKGPPERTPAGRFEAGKVT